MFAKMETPPSVQATDIPEVETGAGVDATGAAVVEPFLYLAAYYC